jgi:hypothetical protein
MTQDNDHLRLLSIFHYVVAGLAALCACLPIIHLVIGLALILAPEKFDGKGGPPPTWFGWMFVVISIVFITLGWVFAGFVLAAGRSLAKRKRYMFCLVMAGVECLFMPFGTVLGIFTIIVLVRESVKELFSANKPLQPPATAP